jgi:aspartyl-tRNA(Asn)/glutamyl-tRNA(Gln) amidotransferase subunit C
VSGARRFSSVLSALSAFHLVLNLYFCFMEVNDSMINKLASLAKLRFNEAEKESIKSDLQKMISFVQKMDEVDTSGVEPLLHISNQPNNWREDVVEGSCSRPEALQNAANHTDHFFLVPKVIQK